MLPTPTILIPSLPPKTFIGIDLVTFTSTTNFHGIRDLPPGWHFLYSGTSEALSLRSGAWFFVHGSATTNTSGSQHNAIAPREEGPGGAEIFIWKWDADTETLKPLSGADADASQQQEYLRSKANLGRIWASGGLFRYRSRVAPSMLAHNQNSVPAHGDDEDEEEIEAEGRRDWMALTSCISEGVLGRIVGRVEIDGEGRERWMVTSAGTARRDADEIPGLGSGGQHSTGEGDTIFGEQQREDEFTFLPIDLKRTWREGAIGRERTEAAQDRSWALGDLIHQYSSRPTDEKAGEDQILGELQFTFLMALTLLNYSCLQQWKRLLELILTSRDAIITREGFMANVLRLLLLQLQRCDDLEGGLFAIDADEGGEFLRGWLVRFTRSVDELTTSNTLTTSSTGPVKTELRRLETWVNTEYEWDLRPEGVLRRGMVQLEDGEEVELEMDGDVDEETGEYAPMVVTEGVY